MGLFDRLRGGAGRRRGTLDRGAASPDRRHLEDFARSRTGVEAYLEPQTAMTTSTVVLVAADGEWTRRRVPSPETARAWAQGLGLPCYDVTLVGYPRRMREWTARRGAAGRGDGAAAGGT